MLMTLWSSVWLSQLMSSELNTDQFQWTGRNVQRQGICCLKATGVDTKCHILNCFPSEPRYSSALCGGCCVKHTNTHVPYPGLPTTVWLHLKKFGWNNANCAWGGWKIWVIYITISSSTDAKILFVWALLYVSLVSPQIHYVWVHFLLRPSPQKNTQSK